MPRYHAREVAIEYARMSDAIVVLGSATPSVDSYYKAKTGVYRLLELDKRVDDRPLPKCEVVDLRQELREETARFFPPGFRSLWRSGF